jgi:ribonucleotide monophosphatase NagD (HAD superfamily)
MSSAQSNSWVHIICKAFDISSWQVTVDGEGLIVMPGTLAKFYKQQGGEVQLMGKPDAIIYKAALEMLPSIPTQSWLAVGDSLEHDIAG